MDKLLFLGEIRSIQPRIKLVRSFDESSHSYLGYVIVLEGWIVADFDKPTVRAGFDLSDEVKIISIAIGPAAQAKFQLQTGDRIGGACVPVLNPQMDVAEYHRVSKLTRVVAAPRSAQTPPPWLTVPPDLATYRQRGTRRLSSATYESKCSTCIWGCQMPVEIIIDNWNPSKRKYRFETFCYGPLNCPFYKAGPKRKVEGRNGMIYVEEDWVDQEQTAHRQPDE